MNNNSPFGNKTPWETSSAFTQRVRDREREEEKIKRLKIILEQSKSQSQFFDTPEIQRLKTEIQQRQDYQNKTYRGLLSGGWGIFSGNNVAEPLEMQSGAVLPEDDGVNLNPFHYLGKGVMATLGGWQKLTEWTAGQTATPFSKQVQRHRRQGLSAGEAWRRSQFETKRFGKSKEEGGFGFNLGVKGAVELLVDPVGTATMLLPMGLLLRPVGKGISTMVSPLPGFKGVRKAGKALRKKGMEKHDVMVKEDNFWKIKQAELQNTFYESKRTEGMTSKAAEKLKRRWKREEVKARKSIAKKLKLEGSSAKEIDDILTGKFTKYSQRMKNGRDADLSKMPNTVTQNYDVFIQSNYDAMLEYHGLNQEGLIADFMRYANSDDAMKSRNIIGRPFWLAIKGTHKLFNSGWSKGGTAHGRATLAHAYDTSMGDQNLKTALNYFYRNPIENLFETTDLMKDVVKGELKLTEHHKTVKMIMKRELMMTQGQLALKGEKGLISRQRAKIELNISDPSSIDGSMFAYDYNGAPRFYMIPKTTHIKFRDELEDLGIPDMDLKDMQVNFAAGASNLAEYNTLKGLTDVTKLAVDQSKGFQSKILEFDIFKINTTSTSLPKGGGGIGKKLSEDFVPVIRKELHKLSEIENNIRMAIERKQQDLVKSLRNDHVSSLRIINELFGEMADAAFDPRYASKSLDGSYVRPNYFWEQKKLSPSGKTSMDHTKGKIAEIDVYKTGSNTGLRVIEDYGEKYISPKKLVYGKPAVLFDKLAKDENVIHINKDIALDQFNRKVWAGRVELTDKSVLSALPENTFKTYDEWEDFLITREVLKKGMKELPSGGQWQKLNKFPNETMGAYEARINKEALRKIDVRARKTDVPTVKIISGGQKGIDSQAWEAANDIDNMGLGGTVARDKSGALLVEKEGYHTNNYASIMTEGENTGRIKKHAQEGYPVRTKQNVDDANGTVYFTENVGSLGYHATLKAAKEKAKSLGKDLDSVWIENPTAEQLREWAIRNNIQTLNVGGARAPSPAFAEETYNLIKNAFGDKVPARGTQRVDGVTDSLTAKVGAGFEGAPSSEFGEAVIYGGGQTVKSGKAKWYKGSPINDSKTGHSTLNNMDEGLQRNKFFSSTVSKERLDDFAELELAEKAGRPLDVMMRNLHRMLRTAQKDPKHGILGGDEYTAMVWRNNDGNIRSHHFGNSFIMERNKAGKASLQHWKTLKDMGILPREKYAEFIKKYPTLETKPDEVIMELTDFLDIGAYVVDWNGPFQKPIRLWNELFDLNEKQVMWLSNYYRMFDEGASMLRNRNISLRNIMEDTSGNYVHHMVEEFADMERLLIMQSKSSATGSAMTKKAYQRSRIFDTVLEGIEKDGLQYNQDPVQMLDAFLRGAHQEVADDAYKMRLRTIAESDLREAGFSLDQLNKWKEVRVKLRKEINSIERVLPIPRILGTVGDDILEGMDRFIHQEKIADISAAGDSWNKIRAQVNALSNESGNKDQIQRIIDDWLDRTNKAHEIKLRDVESNIKQYQDPRKGILSNETQKNWLKRKFGQPVMYRAVRDQRQSHIQELKALKDEDLYFNEKTAALIERELGVTKENAWDDFVKSASTFNDMLRIVQTGFDAGTAFLHGLPTLMRGIRSIPESAITGGIKIKGWDDAVIKIEGNPYLTSWAEGTKQMFRFILERGNAPKLHAKFVSDRFENFQQMGNYGVLISGAGSDFFRARTSSNVVTRLLSEGRYSTTQKKGSVPGFEKMEPIIHQGRLLLDGFQSSFEVFGDILREGLWAAHAKQIMRSGVDDAIKDQHLRQLAEYVNGMTGAFSSRRAGISARQANTERSVIFFSPAYTRATLGLMGSIVKGDLQGSEARASIRAMMGVGIGMHLGQAAINAELRGEDWEDHVNLDPTNGKFLTTRIGSVNVGFGSAWMSMARLFGKLVADPAFRGDVLDSPLLLTGAGKEKAGFDFQGIKDLIQNNQFLYWLRSRSAPMGSSMWDLGMSANFAGRDIAGFPDWFTEIGEQALPFWGSSFMRDQNVLASISDFVGLRSNPLSDWEKRKEVRDGMAQQYFEKSWRSLNDVDRRFLEQNPDLEADPNRQRLNELDSLIKEGRRVIGGSSLDGEMEERQDKLDDYRGMYLAEVKHAEAKLRKGEFSVEQYMKVEQKQRGQYGSRLAGLEEEFPNVERYYESVRGEMGGSERVEDYASQEYAEIYFNELWDMGFMYDYAAREQAIEGWRKQWPDKRFEEYALEKLFGSRWDATPFNQEFYRNRHELFPEYYEDTRKQIFDVRHQGQLNEIYRQWYLAKYNDLKRTQIEEANPTFKTAIREWERLREELRKRNPQLDAFLYRWGYTENLVHPWNQGREIELKSRFPFETYVPKIGVAGQ